MKRSDIDWSILRGSLSLLIVCLIICGGLIIGGHYFCDQMSLEYRRNNAQFQSISQRYLAVDEEEKIIVKFYPQFVSLFNRGIIGKEHRLNWVEVLRKAGNELNIPQLNYVIKSQNSYTPDFAVNLGRYQLRSSNMTLSMQFLHEGDLFYVLDELNKNADGLYNISKCEMTKNAPETIEALNATNVTVKCELHWFTIALADGRELKV